MMHVFPAALMQASSVMAVVFAWLLAVIGFVFCVCLLICLLAVAFDAVTSVLAWWWKLTKHKPRGKLQRILMHQHDGV